MEKGLRKEGEFVSIQAPLYDEMPEVAKLWADAQTMKAVGGAIVFSKERWKDWYRQMVEPTDGQNQYCLVYNQSNEVVGEVSFHRFNQIFKMADFNIKIYDHHRRKGYAKEAMRLMMDYYFNEFGGEILRDEVINEKGQQALSNFGFEMMMKTEQGLLFEMTKTRFTSLRMP